MIIVIALVIIVITILILSYICYRIMSYSGSKRKNYEKMVFVSGYEKYTNDIKDLTEKFVKREYEEIYIKSYDGLWLHGRYYHINDNAPVVIAFHGYRSYAYRDMCGASNEMIEKGYNFLLIDERAHGKSQGKTITFGIKERYDCLSWIEYCIKRFEKDVKIVLCGISMGASTVIFASGLALPQNVKCICADCPFSSPKEIIKKVIKDMKLPKISYIFSFLGALVFGHYNLNNFSLKKEIEKSQIPLLLIHGIDDEFVPYEMSKQIYDIYGGSGFKNKKILLVKEANHGLSYFIDKDNYRKYLNEFLEEVVK